jgi:drug/metabolite transporter (DMT)-like permease
VVSVSTFPIMTALVEPLIGRTAFKLKNVLYALLVLVGTVILLGFSPSETDLSGLLWGFTAAALFVIVHLINKYQIAQMDGRQLSLIQLATAGLALLPWAIPGVNYMSPSFSTDLYLVLFLGVVSTAGAYALYISSMKSLSASTAAILTGLEPIYAISIAAVFLNERLDWSMLVGGAIIIFAVVSSSRGVVET